MNKETLRQANRAEKAIRDAKISISEIGQVTLISFFTGYTERVGVGEMEVLLSTTTGAPEGISGYCRNEIQALLNKMTEYHTDLVRINENVLESL